MSDQLWAIVSRSGAFRLIYTTGSDVHPAEDGHRAELRGKAVWPLDRDPVEGERVDFQTGELIYAPDHAQPGRDTPLERLFSEIKAEAARRILEEYPLWKQLNDRDLPADDHGVIQRKARRDEIRAWSDALEARADAAKSVDELVKIRAELAV